MPQPPTHAPAEAIKISPENLEVANLYLQLQSTSEVARTLDCSQHQVSEVLSRPEVQRYIDKVFSDTGFNNRYLMRSAMDQVLKKKFQELEEAGTGSQKDIADLLLLSHKMSMDYLDRELELEKLRQKATVDNLKTQVNVQINEGGTRYGELINKLLGDKIVND